MLRTRARRQYDAQLRLDGEVFDAQKRLRARAEVLRALMSILEREIDRLEYEGLMADAEALRKLMSFLERELNGLEKEANE